jgi:hypothetical protein
MGLLCAAEVSAAVAVLVVDVALLVLEELALLLGEPEAEAAGEVTEEIPVVPSEDIPAMSPQADSATAIATVAVRRSTAAVRVILLMQLILGR